MKTSITRGVGIVGTIMTALFMAGCGPSQPPAAPAAGTPAPASNAPAARTETPLTGTAAGQVIDDMTGYSTIKAGRQTQDKVRAIAAERDRDLSETMEK